LAKDHEIHPEPGESFAIAGEVIIKIKGFTHAMREGNLVITDRRIAFKGSLTWNSWTSVVRRAAGRGGMDLSIPYRNVREVRDKGYLSGYHLEIFFLDEESGKVKRLRVRIKRWSMASKGLHGARLATEAVHTGEIVTREISFLPIVGDFLTIGADFAEYRAGSKAAAIWIETIQTIMENRGLSFQPVADSELEDEEKSDMNCRKCGATLNPSWKVCPECGADLLSVCRNCGTELEKGWISCPSCGEDLPRICQGCGAELEEDWKSCPLCGGEVGHRQGFG
jgi:RNA polymerase subunit RPABC4/transcription elongation factor Spt4